MPTFASDVIRLRRHLDPKHPVVLWTLDRQRETVVSCCDVSLRAGVRTGMTVAHARARLPRGVMHAEQFDPSATRRALRRLALRMHAFVPTVAIDQRDGLLLDASGCVHLYSTLEQLLARVMRKMARFGISARIAAAPTFTAACALARCRSSGSVVKDVNGIAQATQQLPVTALRLQDGVLHALHEVGVETIGQLRALPRASLADRFGSHALRVLDQLSGRAAESITPVVSCSVIEASHELAGPTTRLDAVQVVTRRVLDKLCETLRKGQLGCRKIVATLDRSDIEPLVLTLQVAKATNDAGHIFMMLRHLLDSAQLGYGVQGVRARAMLVSRLRHEQRQAWHETSVSTPPDALGRFVDACVARMGQASVTWHAPVASYLPENAMVRQVVAELLQPPIKPEYVFAIDRPSRLFVEPVSASVFALVPDGPLVRVTVDGEEIEIASTDGPERIAGEWWRDDASAKLTRDYFRVQTLLGRWLWLFRCSDGRWFVHGEWA